MGKWEHHGSLTSRSEVVRWLPTTFKDNPKVSEASYRFLSEVRTAMDRKKTGSFYDPWNSECESQKMSSGRFWWSRLRSQIEACDLTMQPGARDRNHRSIHFLFWVLFRLIFSWYSKNSLGPRLLTSLYTMYKIIAAASERTPREQS